jgi:uncharacterized protein YfaS (alpha-2-macroglobulin family)
MFTTNFKKPFLWSVLVLVLVLAAGLIAIAIEKPTGTISGKIDLEEPGFQLSTYNIRDHRILALAVGPSGGKIIERGVWVKPDGSFRINQLPVGEYQVRVRATGFSTAAQSGVFVDEAKVSQIKNPVHLALLEPSLNIASNTRVFTPQEAPHFWVNATGSERATIRIYRKDILSMMASKHLQGLEFSSDLSLYKPYDQKDHPLFEKEQPLQTLTRKLNPDSEDWSHAEFKLNKPLAAGEYLVVAEVAGIKNRSAWNVMWFSVSRLGLIVKQAPEQTLVRAIDLITLQPLPQVSVHLKDKDRLNGKPLAIGVTGSDGFAHFPGITKPKDSSLLALGLALGQNGAQRAFGGNDYWGGNTPAYHTYFYTERPIYRLGQTVYFKGITRLQSPNGLKTPHGGLPIKINIEDPDNTPLWEGKLTANAFGSFNGIYQVPADAKTGTYQVTLTYPDQSTSYHRFEVAQYRKPEYQVDVIPLQTRIIAGSKAKARIRATYYFGAPVTNARIKYSIYAASDWSERSRLMPRPAYYAYFDDWEEDESGEGGEYGNSYAGAYISEGYAQTDATGEAIIEYDTQPVSVDHSQPYSSDYQDKRYTVQAEVTDLSRIVVLGSGSQSATAGNFTLFIQPDHEVTRAGEPVKATVTAIDYQGKPVANHAVTVALTRWNWDNATEAYRGSTVAATSTATTDAQGKARVTLSTTDQYFTDNYFLSAEAKDDSGHTLYDQTGVWVASKNFPYIRDGESAQQEAFSVKPDKKIYQPGDVAKVMITAPLSGKEHSDLMVSIEGSKLHEVRTLPMDATAKLVEIPIRSSYEPNVYITATIVGPKRQLYNQSTLLKVSPEAHFLHLSIQTDKPRYKPGDTATYTIKATNIKGEPVPKTELSLGVVDESIYAIRPEAASDIRKFFYAKIENAVSTFSSFPEDFSGGPDKIEPRVRKDFRDMAAWLPNLVTDANGVATATVKLPDNLTTWRATVRGITQSTDAGSAVAKVIATQDLIVRLALPRFYTQYDEGVLSAIVHNYTDRPQQVRLSLAASPQFRFQQSLFQNLTIKPEGSARYDWHALVKQAGQGTVQVKAIGQTAGDALELQIPIRPLSVEITQAAAGILKNDPDMLDLPYKIPAGTAPELARILVSVSSSAIGPVLGSFNSLINYPYGCTEQTMSRLMPAVIAKSLSQNLGIPLDTLLDKRFGEVATQALAKLKSYHQANGGWGWWQYDPSDAYLTAYVMEGLFSLRQVGYPISNEALPERWQADGIAYLKKNAAQLTQQLADPKIAAPRHAQMDRLIDLAYMYYVLSLYDQKPNHVARAFWQKKFYDAPPEALAYVTLAFQRAGDSKVAQQSDAAMNRLANRAGDMLSWDHTPKLLKLLQLKDYDYTYRFTGVETTALALRASVSMQKHQPNAQNADRLDRIERWLLLQRNPNGWENSMVPVSQETQANGGGWENTKTTAAVLRALMEKAVAQHQTEDSQFTVSSNLWSTAKQFTQQNLYGPEQTTSALLSEVPAQRLHLDKQGPGQLYYTSLLTYPLALKPSGSVPQMPMPHGLQIQRTFYRIQSEPVGPQGTMRLKTQQISDGKVHAGETVLMRVVVNTPVALPYAMLDVSLPSGGEIISSDPRENQLNDDAQNASDFQFDWGNWWWSHQDILDDRVVMFASHIPVGKSEFHALVRMELPGRFQMNPIKLSGMYTKRIQAYSTLDQVEVIE